MEHVDLEIEIGGGVEPRAGPSYPVAVLRSPAGRATGTLQLPYDSLALENRLQALQLALLSSGRGRRRVVPDQEALVRQFGCELFDALFADEIRSLYDVSRREAAERGQGLRVKLRFGSAELAALPWEYLYDDRRAEFLCLSLDTPVMRYLELPQQISPLAVRLPLRILGMIASPSDLERLDVERERQRVDDATRPLQERGLVELHWIEGRDWRALHRELRRGPWHVFHFIGHGGFDASRGEGLIALEGEDGQAHRLYATELGRLLGDHHSLRLAMLNSCEGARGDRLDVFSSTAAILVRRGTPAVVAMQYEITDLAAIELARTFYEAVADGYAVDVALAEARKAVSLALNGSLEWGTPVLFVQAPDGVLFKIDTTAAVARPATPPTPDAPAADEPAKPEPVVTEPAEPEPVVSEPAEPEPVAPEPAAPVLPLASTSPAPPPRPPTPVPPPPRAPVPPPASAGDWARAAPPVKRTGVLQRTRTVLVAIGAIVVVLVALAVAGAMIGSDDPPSEPFRDVDIGTFDVGTFDDGFNDGRNATCAGAGPIPQTGDADYDEGYQAGSDQASFELATQGFCG